MKTPLKEYPPLIAIDYDSIPEELKALPQWVGWQLSERFGDVTKLPINPHSGELASTTDATTWGTFAAAKESAAQLGLSGIGFVFSVDDPTAASIWINA